MYNWIERGARSASTAGAMREPNGQTPTPEASAGAMTSLAPFRSRIAARAAGSLIPAILCGGSGYAALAGVAPEPRQAACRRCSAAPRRSSAPSAASTGELFAAPIVVSAAASRFLVAEQAAEVGRRDRARARARRPRHAGRGDARRLPRRPARPFRDRPRDAVRPPDPRPSRPSPDAAAAAARIAPDGPDRRLGNHADRALDRLRLHRPRRRARRRRHMRSPVSWRSPTRPAPPS